MKNHTLHSSDFSLRFLRLKVTWLLAALPLLVATWSGAESMTNSLRIENTLTNLRLNYSLSTSNGVFFIVNSDNLQSLFADGSVFFAGYHSNTASGSITSSILPSATANFFTVFEYPDALPEDIEPPINDEESPNLADYYFDVDGLPYPLSANVPIHLTIYVNDGAGNLQPVNGTIQLTLLDGVRETPSFSFTITPLSIPVTNGVGQGTITIQATNSLSECVLVATFSPTSALAPKLLGKSPRPQNAAAGGSAVVVTSTTRKPLADYRDPDRTNWRYPLTNQFKITGTFGEWPGHTDIHTGIDFNATEKTVVRAAKKGIVTKVGTLKGNTNLQFVTIDHGNGCATRYLHIKPCVSVDDIVQAGGAVGVVAPTSWTGFVVHFHFEMMRSPNDVTTNYNYTRYLTLPFPLVNPINRSNEFVFDTPLTVLDANPPKVKAVMITKKNPAINIYNNLLSARTFSEAESDISIGYFLAQIVDGEGGKITPMDIHFFADKNPEQIIDYQSSTNIIRNFRTNSSTPGYARLSSIEMTNKLSVYKYWFKWDTSSYVSNTIGPRTVRLVVNDVAGRRTTNHFTFGPKIIGGGQLVPGQYFFTAVAYLGTNSLPALNQPDRYKMEIIQSNGGVLPAVQWGSPITNGLTPVLTTHLQTNNYTFTLPPNTITDGLKLRVSSRLATNIADQVDLCCGCSSVGHYNCSLGYTSGNNQTFPSKWTWTCTDSNGVSVNCSEPKSPGWIEN